LSEKSVVRTMILMSILVKLLMIISLAMVFYYVNYLPRLEAIDYFDLFSDSIIALMTLVMTHLVVKQGHPRSIIAIFLVGFSCLYISLLVDTLDEIFITPRLMTNIGENLLQVVGYIGIFIGVFKWLQLNRRTQEKLSQLSNTDALTGLLNRRSFFEKSSEEFERSIRYDRPLSLMMIDIDFFKMVNDRYGHMAGDVVLQKIAHEITLQLRTNDIFCRWGGEEFILLIPESDKNNGQSLSEKIRKSIGETPVELKSGEVVNIKISIGCTSIRENDSAVEALIERADRALYMSKEAGRNRVSFL
jgi:diguanylate cyclase (GGDEF)-like protein